MAPGAPALQIVVGIDEAGYSPLLGPLVISASIFGSDEPITDWWQALGIPKAGRGRGGSGDPLDRTRPPKPLPLPIVDDSKKIYTPSEGLEALETSVLAFLTVSRDRPQSLRDLLDAVGACAEPDEYPWYRGADVSLPVAADPQRVQACADALLDALRRAGAQFYGFHSSPILEGELNRLVARSGNKANLLLTGTLSLVERSMTATRSGVMTSDPSGAMTSDPSGVMTSDPSGVAANLVFARSGSAVEFLIDKQGGRDFYSDALSQFFFGSRVTPGIEGNDLSRYSVEYDGCRFDASFCVRGDASHLPIALASMLSKYIRELFMTLFNRYWHSIDPALPRTSGYRTDGWRFVRALEASMQNTRVPKELLIRQK